MNTRLKRKTDSTIRLVVHPGSAPYIARVLSIRFPNVRFEVRDPADNCVYAHARERFTDQMQREYYDAISVLQIVYQLTGGKIGEVIHG